MSLLLSKHLPPLDKFRIYILSIRAFGLISALLLSACGSPSSGPVSRASLMGEGGVTVDIKLGDAKNSTIASGRTGLMNITSTSQFVQQPMRFTASLGNSTAAQKVRAEGKTLYVYAATKLLLEVTEKGRKGIKEGGINLEGSSCEGYKFVLYPGNNYSVSLYAEPKIRIRNKSRADTPFGKHTDDWVASSREAFSSVIAVRSKPFMVVGYGDRYMNPVNYGPAVTVSHEFDRSCTLSASKEFFKSKGREKNKSGNVVRRAPKKAQ